MYFSFIRPILEYGDIIFDNCPNYCCEKLESVNIEAARIVTGATKLLAMVQTNTIIRAIKEHHPNVEFQIVSMDTIGDKVMDRAITKIGETSVFTRELEVALLEKEVDMVVHSFKDLPAKLPDGLVVGCVYTRDSPYDVIAMHSKYQGKTLQDLPPNSVIGTSSLRRMAQIARTYPHLKFENIRGNLNTRFQKLDEGDKYSALILAEAGLVRMGWENRISEKLHSDVCMYAVCQGAIGVECLEGDANTLRLLSCIHDPKSALECIAERSFFKQLDVGYKVPVSVHTEVTKDKIQLSGGVFSIDGTESKIETITKNLSDTNDNDKVMSDNDKVMSDNDKVMSDNDKVMSDNDKFDESLTRREYLGISPPPGVTQNALSIAENVGIELAAIIVNDEKGEELLSIAKSQTEAVSQAAKQRKAIRGNIIAV
ncbi:hypothetical protein FSP39_012658 [Pinctada imbricata]|uniref:hydroxymethylbilane synthase n=1 Tax=Pinctada imbricata TaxID=66713 RepID=A0AA89BZB4_PINIB|nr:hypothetical protein FSP39_012658 [Pinctada imbricata]